METYNHGCHTGADRADGFHTLDQLLAEGRRLDLIATDDAHFTEPDHFGGWVMVKAPENEPEALVEGLKAGTFYSSQGPELRDIRITDRNVEVDSSAVVSMIVQSGGNKAKAVHGLSMTSRETAAELFHSVAVDPGDGDRRRRAAGVVKPDLAGLTGTRRAGRARSFACAAPCASRCLRRGYLPTGDRTGQSVMSAVALFWAIRNALGMSLDRARVSACSGV